MKFREIVLPALPAGQQLVLEVDPLPQPEVGELDLGGCEAGLGGHPGDHGQYSTVQYSAVQYLVTMSTHSWW